jgi:hypothetical protein
VTVVVVLGGLPPWPGLWFQQSPLEHFPNTQVELQYCEMPLHHRPKLKH